VALNRRLQPAAAGGIIASRCTCFGWGVAPPFAGAGRRPGPDATCLGQKGGNEPVASAYTIRRALRSDVDVLVAFTLQEAYEAEGTNKDEAAVRRGVEGAFADPPLAAYWVAEAAEKGVVASTSVVTEWSDFNGGHYWWVQSLFIVPEHRGGGLVELLIGHLARARSAAGALDLRLYAHSSNERALRAYRRCGFTIAPYVIMRLPPGQR